MMVSIDSIEDKIAVLEFDNKVRLKMPASGLPANAREGDCFTLDSDGRLTPAPDETTRRRKRNIDLFKSLLAE